MGDGSQAGSTTGGAASVGRGRHRGEDQATVTVLETVANGATLLATQSFERAEEEWVLRSHHTIPYGKDTVAKIALRCDERGCVAVPAKAVASE